MSDLAAPPLALVAASVDPDGTLHAPDLGWLLTHKGPGRYDLVFPEPTVLAVRSWATAAKVTVRPLTPTWWVVEFLAGNEPVDAAFSFLASPAEPAE